MDTSDYKPVGDVVGPLEVMELPEGYIAIDTVLVIKALDSDGKVCWLTRFTRDPHAIEFLGALSAAVMLMKQDIFEVYQPEKED